MTVSTHLGLFVPTFIYTTELVFLGSRGSSVHRDEEERDRAELAAALSLFLCLKYKPRLTRSSWRLSTMSHLQTGPGRGGGLIRGLSVNPEQSGLTDTDYQICAIY